MPRLFTALELPDDVTEALGRLRQPLPGAKWVSHDQMHLTLRFAGDIDNRQADEFADALGEIAVAPFDVQLAAVDVFGGATPRVLWAGVQASEALTTLAQAHEKAARRVGLMPETRKFRPHVTLARLNGTPVDLVARFLQRRGGFALPAFVAERFVLYSSKPHVGGGPYVIESAYPFLGVGHHFDDDDYEGSKPL